jgi:ABC-2 type transport system permease protein
MSGQRIWILLGKELRQGATNFFFIYSLVIPVLLSLLVALVFGDLFAQTPRLGIYAADGNGRLTTALLNHESINTTLYNFEAELAAAVERGTVEIGLSLPAGIDDALENGSDVHFTVYRWGEAGVRSLLLLETAVGRTFVNMTGVELPVTVHSEQLGSANTATWSQRLLPLLIIMAVMLGGLLIPASSLIEEKQKRTLVALITTPTSLLDVYLAKALLGFLISAIMGTIILLLNDAFGNQPLLLLAVVAMGAIMASAIGAIIGSLVNDMDALMGVIKAFGIILFAPGILEMFPQVPEWIGRFFPTYYVMNPLLEVSQNGARFGDVAEDLAILAAIVGLLLLALSRVLERQQHQVALAS